MHYLDKVVQSAMSKGSFGANNIEAVGTGHLLFDSMCTLE